MVTRSLEKPSNSIRFDGLSELRERLSREAKNAERLEEFQRTIDEELRKWEREGVIEFTENEWRDLITNENLPPIERVKKLLQEKIEGMEKVQKEARKESTSFRAEIEEKKKELGELWQKKIEELKKKAEWLKKYSKPALWLMGIGLSFQIFGYKIANWFSGLLGKKGEYDEKIKLAEMEKEFLKDPEAAAKKYGEEVTKKMQDKTVENTKEWEETPEEGKEDLNKTGPLAVLGGAGIGILALMKGKLPTSITERLNTNDKKDFLSRLTRNRALKLFWISGITLLGIGTLYSYIEKNSSELAEIPTDAEGKKTWWKNAIEKAGIGAKEGAEEIWSIINGEKLDDYLTEKEEEDAKEMEKNGYVRLSEHETIKEAKTQIDLLMNRCEQLYNEHRDFFNGSAFAGLVLKPGLIAGAALKWWAVALSLLGHASPSLVLPAGLVMGLTMNSFEAIKHIRVPKNLWPEDIKDLINIPDIGDFLKSHISPDILENIHFETVAEKMRNLETEIQNFNAENIMKNATKGIAERLIQTESEKINNVNAQWISAFISTLKWEDIRNKGKWYEKLIGENGVLESIKTKLLANQSLTEGDIREMMEAAEWSNVRIFPEGDSKSGKTIQYAFIDEHGNVSQEPKNICINPTIHHADQYEEAHDFVVNEYELSVMTTLGKTASEFRKRISDFTLQIKENHEKSGSILEAFFRDGLSMAVIGTETFLIDPLGNKYFVWPWNLLQSTWLNIKNPEDKLEMQEWLVEYGQGLAPVFLMTAAKNFATGHGFLWMKKRGLWNAVFKNTIVQSVTYPAHLVKNVARWGILCGKYIGARALSGNYKDIFSDPKNEIKAKFYETKHRLKSLKMWVPASRIQEIWGIHHSIAKLEEARSLLYKAKQNTVFGKGHTEEALKILEWEWGKFDKLKKWDYVSPEQIKKLLTKVEESILEEREKLNYLEKWIREKFPQELENRNTVVEAKKQSIDITTEKGKEEARKALEESQREIERMEEERITAEKELKKAESGMKDDPNNQQLRNEYNQKKSRHMQMITDYKDRHRDLSEIREAMWELLHGRKPKIKLTEQHAKSVKWLRGSAKIFWILALTIGAGYGIDKITDYLQGDSYEAWANTQSNSDDEKYYGFKKKSEQVSENKERWNNREKNEFFCETPEEFQQKVEAIETQYTESIEKFMDPEWVQNVSTEEREKRIQEAADGHMLRVDLMKSLIGANKGMMEWFWNKHFTNESGEEIVPEGIRKEWVKAFMFIHKKQGELTLEYMSHQDMKNVFYILWDQNHQNWAEKNLGSWAAFAGETALRVLPFTGSYMDWQDAWESFSRGNISDGIWSTAWCLGGLVLDVGWLVSFGGTTAAASWLRATRAGVKAVEIGKNVARAWFHNGIQLWVQFGQKLAKIPRSESIKISDIQAVTTGTYSEYH